jgi:hypothetical protein
MNTNKQGYFFVPGETELSVRDIQKELNFNFGWPWPESTKAVSVIPHFSDDAKTKALALLGPNGTLKDLSEMLALTGECGSGRFSAFFILDLSVIATESTAATKGSILKETVSQEDFEAIEHTMLSTEFDTKDHALEATRKIREKLHKLAVVGVPVVAVAAAQKDTLLSGNLEGQPPATPIIHSVPVKRVAVTNNISHLVKKKKVAQ